MDLENYKLKKIIHDVTCIMSVYKNDQEAWVSDSILSILEGEELPGEFLIYCDGPIQSSVRKLLHLISKKYKDIICLYEQDINMGRAYSRQFMIEKARGKYVLLMDADDISTPDRLKLQYAHAISHPELDLIGGYIIEFSDDFDDRFRKVPLFNSDIKKMMKYAQPLNHVTLLARREFIINIGGYVEAGNCEDFNFFARCFVNGAVAENLAKVLVRVRVDKNFINRRRGWLIGLDEYRVIKLLWEYKYINFFEFLIFGTYRFSIRILPSWILLRLYSINRSSVVPDRKLTT
jgi:glycosyltransferase involved in cell wall biosynthesis